MGSMGVMGTPSRCLVGDVVVPLGTSLRWRVPSGLNVDMMSAVFEIPEEADRMRCNLLSAVEVASFLGSVAFQPYAEVNVVVPSIAASAKTDDVE